MNLFRITEKKLQDNLDKLIINIKNFLKKNKCVNCDMYNLGCNSQDIETAEFILNGLQKNNLIQEGYLYFDKKSLENRDQSICKIFICSGESMYPEINQGDIILIKSFKEYNVGDICLFFDTKYKDRKIHKIIGEDNAFIYFKGNNTKNQIEKVRDNEIIGKVCLIIKPNKNKEIYNFLIKYMCENGKNL